MLSFYYNANLIRHSVDFHGNWQAYLVSRAFSNISVKKKTSNYIKYYNNNNLVEDIVSIASTIRLQLVVQAEWALYIYIYSLQSIYKK